VAGRLLNPLNSRLLASCEGAGRCSENRAHLERNNLHRIGDPMLIRLKHKDTILAFLPSVMAGLVPAIHVYEITFAFIRGYPAQGRA
jgi:hypothetical protein